MDSFIEEVVAIADSVAARRRSGKRIMLSFDEWNVWYRTRRPREARTRPGWPVAPPIIEELYNVQDALAFGGTAISLLNHADRVRCACLAQLVNVIAPIMTETGGARWRQTIFWPFAQFSDHGRGARVADLARVRNLRHGLSGSARLERSADLATVRPVREARGSARPMAAASICSFLIVRSIRRRSYTSRLAGSERHVSSKRNRFTIRTRMQRIRKQSQSA